MKHTLQINVSKKVVNSGILSCQKITIREKILRLLLGEKQKLTILVPGDSVKELSINEITERSQS